MDVDIQLDSFKTPYPAFSDAVEITLPVDLCVPSQKHIKGAKQKRFTKDRRAEIKKIIGDKRYQPTSKQDLIALVSDLLFTVILIYDCSTLG